MSIGLKLKFKCKMKVELRDGTSSGEVAQENSIFTFEQIIKIYNKHEIVELFITLLTEKGSQYNAGVVRINLS